VSKIIKLRQSLLDIFEAGNTSFVDGKAKRVIIIIDGGTDDELMAHGFEYASEIKHLLHDWYEKYLIEEIEIEIE